MQCKTQLTHEIFKKAIQLPSSIKVVSASEHGYHPCRLGTDPVKETDLVITVIDMP